MVDYNIDSPFATPIYKSTLSVPDSVYLDLKSEPVVKSPANNGYFSRIEHKEKYTLLIEEIGKHVKGYMDWIFHADKRYTYACNGAWVNKHDPGDMTQEHSHSHALVSGIFYVDIPEPAEKAGPLTFIDHSFYPFTEFFNLHFDQYNSFNSKKITYIPRKGDIYLFPSHLKHSVGTNMTQFERWSMAFDFTITTPLSHVSNMMTILPTK